MTSNLPPDILEAWSSLERECPNLANLATTDLCFIERQPRRPEYTLHVFGKALEQAYSSLGYLATNVAKIHVVFIMAMRKSIRAT